MANYCLIFMPISTLIQGIAYLGLAIWGLTMQACSSEIINICRDPFGFVLDLIYFFDESCGNPNVTVSGYLNPVTLNDTNYAKPTMKRTQGILIAYLIISVMWIVLSMFVISSFSCSNKKAYKLYCFGCWFTVVIAGCILDAVATGFHIYDVVHTTSADNTFSYLGISTTAKIMSYIRCYDEYFVAPALVMMAASSRALIIWLINVFGLFYCSKEVKIYLRNDIIATSTTVLVTEDQNKPAETEVR